MTLISASSLFAQERYLETFNEYEIPAGQNGIILPVTGAERKWWSRSVDPNRQVEVSYDANNYFGAGTGNKVLRMARLSGATADHNALTVPFEGLQTGMVSFDFYVGEGAIAGDSGFRLNLMSNIATNFDNYNQSYAASGLFITSSAVHSKAAGGAAMQATKFDYEAGQKNNLMIVFNNSVTAFDYAGGSVNSGYMDIYLNGTKAVTWELRQGSNSGIGTNINGLWLSLPNGVTGEIFMDSILVSAQPIPEASTLSFVAAILAAGVFGGLRRRKQQR